MGLFAKADLPITPSLICLVVCNLLDAICTITLINLGLAIETNPVMAWAYRISPLTFMAVKICFVHTAILIAMISPNQRAKRFFLRFGALLYLTVLIYQGFLLFELTRACS